MSTRIAALQELNQPGTDKLLFPLAANLDIVSLVSFLDNLESALKNMESRDERDPKARKRRDSELASVLAAAPWAEKLKNSSYVEEVLKSAAHIGHQTRSKIRVAWLGTTLKLEAKNRHLELRPTPEGIVAVFLHNGKEEGRLPVDLTASANELVQKWLGHLGSDKLGSEKPGK